MNIEIFSCPPHPCTEHPRFTVASPLGVGAKARKVPCRQRQAIPDYPKQDGLPHTKWEQGEFSAADRHPGHNGETCGSTLMWRGISSSSILCTDEVYCTVGTLQALEFYDKR